VVGTLGEQVVATLLSPGVPADAPLGARIEAPITRAIVAYWRPAAYDPIADVWTAVLEPPLDAGEYNLVWRTGDPEPPAFETFIPLSMVAASALLAPPPTDPPQWAPSVADVAEVVTAYTRGGFDDEGQFSGRCRPTRTRACRCSRRTLRPLPRTSTGLIKAACDEVHRSCRHGRPGVAVRAGEA
jgi:hypothetical protein